ncbi:rhodanese-like domain-containing protein [Methylomonas sp. MK1]|uniref:rhodanese-like domain-containing protein n=1 Tax=Methylomonas sp. MK1 TaxID=1131552 RepID=UPI0003A9BD52
MNSDDVVVLDVREANEFVKSHIENAINIPLGKLEEQISSLEKHKNHPMIVTCQTGARSVAACKTLTKTGFDNVFNMSGGMQSWEDNKLPIKVSSKN